MKCSLALRNEKSPFMHVRFAITLLVSVALATVLSAQPKHSITVNGQFEQQPIETILRAFAERHQIRFFYQNEWLSPKDTSVTFANAPIDEALNSLLTPQQLSYFWYSDYAVVIAPAAELDRELGQDFYIARQNAMQQSRQVEETQDIITIGMVNTMNASGEAKVRGFITDDNFNDPLMGATLLVEAKGTGTATDETGQYELTLPVGKNAIVVQAVGFESKELILEVYTDGTADIELTKEAVNLDEVVISAEALDENVRSTQMGVERLSTDKIKQIPSFLGEADVVRSLLLLPGVSTVGEGAPGFNVRGGSVDQNLIMLDGAPMFNASHVLGFFSLFNPDMVQNVTLYKGSIPAKYGGRLSSVLDVQMKEGNYKEFTGRGGVGIVASRLVLETPIQKGKSSLIVGGRSSYSDWILNQINVIEVQQSSAFFYDANAKFTQRFGVNTKISLSGYSSYDRFRFSDRFSYNYGTQVGNFSWNQIYAPNLSSSLSVIYSVYNSTLSDPNGSNAFDLDAESRFLKIKPNFVFTPNAQHTVQFGGELVDYAISPGDLSPNDEASVIAPREVETEYGREFALYINDEFIINPRLSIEAGLRFSYFQNLGPNDVFLYEENTPRTVETIVDTLGFGNGSLVQTYSGWEPRLSAKISLTDVSSLKISYNRTVQYINQISNTAAVTPVDVWKLSDRYVEPQRANSYSLGYFHNFDDNRWESSLEVYYRDIKQVVEFKDLAQLLANDHIETELLNGIGRTYGAEFSLKRKVGRWTGWLGYTYSRTQRQVQGSTAVETINEGEWYPSNFDKPHDLTLTTTFQFDRRNSLSFNFTYSTGRPTSAPVGRFSAGNALNIPVYSERNQYRIPDYHRLDVSYTLGNSYRKDKSWRSSWTISIYNLYARKNAYTVFFTQQPFNNPTANRLAVLGSIFPALTYNFRF